MEPRRLMKLFSLTPEDYKTIFKFQQGFCAICERPLKKANVDHRHTDGLIRGLLCWICNKMLGLARDNPEFLRRGAGYLEHPPAIQALGAARFGRPGRITNKSRKK